MISNNGGGIDIGSKKDLTNEQKVIISYMYQKLNISVGKIADTLEISRRSVYNYRDFRMPRKLKEHPVVERRPKIKRFIDSDEFLDIHRMYENNHWFEHERSNVHEFVKDRFWNKKLKQWNEFQEMKKPDILNTIVDLLEKQHRDIR